MAEEVHIRHHFSEEFYKALERLAVPHGLTADIKQIKATLGRINRKENIIMSKQDDLDALAQHENDDLAAIATSIQTVSAEVLALQQANPDLDLSKLTAAMAGLDAVPAAILAVVPPAPTA